MTRNGYTFKGWSTDPTGSVTHSVGANRGLTKDLHLYAVWVKDAPKPVTYTVSYAPGGTNVQGLPSGATLEAGNSYTVAGAIPTRAGYAFRGWSSSLGSTLQAGANFTMPGANVILTATWEQEPAVVPTPEPETPVNNPGTTAPVNNPDTTVPPIEQSPITAPTSDSASDVLNGSVPLGHPGITNAWSLLSLILGVIGTIDALILLIGYAFRRKNDKTTDSVSKRTARNAGIAKIVTIVFGALVILSFFVFDNMARPVVWINQWSILVASIFVLHILSLVIYRRLRAQKDKETNTFPDEVILEY
jgi:uncharacterized repeat protein (TIGR02543 family)